MIEKVIEHINENLKSVKGFDHSRIRGLSEYVVEPEKKYPGIYKGNDTIDFITSNDFRSGVIWHMKAGDLSTSDLDSFGRSKVMQYNTPMRCYAIIRRDSISDSPYSPDELALNILNTINERNVNSLKATLNLMKVQIQAGGYGVDKDELEQIFQGIDIENLRRYDIMYCSINYNIILTGKQQCFVKYTC